MLWRDLLEARIAETSCQQVAYELGVSRAVVSLIHHDKYPARPDRVARLVLETYDRVHCPHLDQDITRAACRRYHTAAAPTSSPRAMRHWRACQICPRSKDHE